MGKKIIIDFTELCEKLIELCEEYGYIPTWKDINANNDIPNVGVIVRIFKENGYKSYTNFLNEKGFTTICFKSPYDDYTPLDIDEIWEKYHLKNGKYPTAHDCNTDINLPSWGVVKKILCDNLNSFYERYNYNVYTKSYEEYCNMFKDISNQKGRILTIKDLAINEYGLPHRQWFISNCPDRNVVNYNDFINYLGLKPYYDVSKEYVINHIMSKYKHLNRPLKTTDFESPEWNEVGLVTITKIWGTFNKMLLDLSLPFNKNNTRDRHKSIEELKNDIIKLCNFVYQTKGIKNITFDDIENCEWCLDKVTYNKWFKQKLNMTLGEFIESIGFIPNKQGIGMIFEFEDGEKTKSTHEYKVSTYLKNMKIKYERNVPYKDFIDFYVGRKDCDYVINYNNKVWYIEIAGMLNNEESLFNDSDKGRRKKYRIDMQEKINMMKKANLNYKIIYTHDMKYKSLEEVFSFLHNEDNDIGV